MPHAEGRIAEQVRVQSAGRRLLLLLDFDGTLCEFDPDPRAVHLSPTRRAILQGLQRQATIGIVSGRRLVDVRARAGLDGIVLAGLHGLEIEALGEHFVHPDLDRAAVAVEEVITSLRPAIATVPGVFLEDKGAAVALHFREAGSDAHRAALAAFASIAGPYLVSGRLRVMRGSFVLELLPNIDWNKGHAVRWITDHVGRLEGETFVVYIGDDVTDQDAFAVLEENGLPIAASDRVNATTRLDGPAAVERFLAAL
jgi:trehalose-phosphatase